MWQNCLSNVVDMKVRNVMKSSDSFTMKQSVVLNQKFIRVLRIDFVKSGIEMTDRYNFS